MMINFTEGKFSKVTGEICLSSSDPSASAVFVVLNSVVRLRSLPLSGFIGFVEGNTNSQKYVEILGQHQEPSARKLFSSDHWILEEGHASSHEPTQSRSNARKRQHEMTNLPWPAWLPGSQSDGKCFGQC